MAGPIYCATNLLESASSVSWLDAARASSEDANLPASNLYNRRASKTAKSAKAFNSVNGSPQYIEIDHGATKQPTFCAIINHNLPSGGTYTLETSDAPDFSTNLTTIATFTHRDTDMYAKFAASTARRYTRLKMVATDAVTPEIGELVLGNETQLSRAFRWGFQDGRSYNIISHETIGRHRWTARVNELRRFVLAFQFKTRSEADELMTYFDATGGGLNPHVFVPYPDHSDPTIASSVFYVYAQGEVQRVFAGPQEIASTIELIEHPRGINL